MADNTDLIARLRRWGRTIPGTEHAFAMADAADALAARDAACGLITERAAAVLQARLSWPQAEACARDLAEAGLLREGDR